MREEGIWRGKNPSLGRNWVARRVREIEGNRVKGDWLSRAVSLKGVYKTMPIA